MKKPLITAPHAALLSLMMASPLIWAAGAARGGLAPHGAAEFPQSAYAACAGKAIGDVATDGEVTGTCQVTKDHRVAVHPNDPKPKPK